jgi:RNA polymerase sigma-70 factor (ECF subfamily)
LDDPDVRQLIEVELAVELPPDVLFDRRWAIQVLEHALSNLRREYESAGQAERFTALEPVLSSARSSEGYTELATRLNLTVNGVKAAVRRMRHRFRDLLQSEVADTVENPSEVDDEMNHLFAILRNSS